MNKKLVGVLILLIMLVVVVSLLVISAPYIKSLIISFSLWGVDFATFIIALIFIKLVLVADIHNKK